MKLRLKSVIRGAVHSLISGGFAEESAVFMHELGHNLGLEHYDDDIAWWQTLWGYTFGEGKHESCMSYVELGETTDYADFEWNIGTSKAIILPIDPGSN